MSCFWYITSALKNEEFKKVNVKMKSARHQMLVEDRAGSVVTAGCQDHREIPEVRAWSVESF